MLPYSRKSTPTRRKSRIDVLLAFRRKALTGDWGRDPSRI